MKKYNLKVVKCPECGEDITTLQNVQTGTATWDMDGRGHYDHKNMIFDSDGGENSWLCPYCDEELFYNEEDAIKFLQGKKVKR